MQKKLSRKRGSKKRISRKRGSRKSSRKRVSKQRLSKRGSRKRISKRGSRNSFSPLVIGLGAAAVLGSAYGGYKYLKKEKANEKPNENKVSIQEQLSNLKEKNIVLRQKIGETNDINYKKLYLKYYKRNKKNIENLEKIKNKLSFKFSPLALGLGAAAILGTGYGGYKYLKSKKENNETYDDQLEKHKKINKVLSKPLRKMTKEDEDELLKGLDY
jgi:hypothetical protein